MQLAVIKYNAGNIRSVDFALQRLGINANITNDPEIIKSADKVIFPGVGEASTTMAFMKENNLDTLIKELKQPVLGICLGLQLMCTYSEENDTPCIGIFDEIVRRFQPDPGTENTFKVPHMGWNSLQNVQPGIFDSSFEDNYVYFVHSFYAEPGKNTAAETNYIHPFSSVLQKDNFYATQFHPEKSGAVGERILKNFLSL
ncbi:MAG: imidazole glycerol phosphate synthase subunit HisH [Bacteroidota bacterium]